jgi:glycosyltransferase involved in cell wall biosynthesis
MTSSARIGVIALVPDRWDDVVMPRHQVLRRLARRFPVVWMDPPRNWRDYLKPGTESFLAPDRWRSPVPGLEVLTPGMRHPLFYRPPWLHARTLRSRLAAARRRLLAKGVERIVLYVWRDEFAEVVDHVEHDTVLYHIDDEYSFSPVDVPISPREADLIRRADDVIVHSARLFEKKSGINPATFLVPNGVDYDAFATRRDEPPDLAAIARPRIGYAGVIKMQLDLALLDALAAARPDLSFVLVGPVGNVEGKARELESLRARPNVHFLGRKPVEDLGAYTQHFDACLMCYEVNAYTHCIYPLKMHEYLASGRPTISSPIRSVLEHADVVRVADGREDWLSAIDESLAPDAGTPAAIARRKARATQFEWNGIADRIAGIIADRVATRYPQADTRPMRGTVTAAGHRPGL